MNRFLLSFFLLLLSVSSFSSNPMRFACIGDSITAGDSYPSVLQGMMGDGYVVRNYGISARVMQNEGDYPYMKEETYSELKAWLPDIVTIMLGTNDSKYHNWKDSERFRNDYLAMIDELRAIPTHPVIFLCLPPKPSQIRFGINDSTIVAGIIPVIESFRGRRWLDIIDTYSPFDGHPELFVSDGIHPNPDGVKVLAETIYAHLDRCGMTGRQGKRVVFIGDSITDGDWGKADGKQSENRNCYDMNHVYGHGFMSMCATHFLSEYPEKRFRFYNRGLSGNRLIHLEERWEKDVIALHPDVVSILVGVNDSRDKPLDEYDFVGWEARYRRILDRTLVSNPSVRFVLCAPFLEKVGAVSYNKDFPGQKAIVEKMAAIVRRIASDYGAVLVPFDDEMDRLLSTDRSGDIHYWTWDGVHPTYAGHSFLAKLWIEKAGYLLE